MCIPILFSSISLIFLSGFLNSITRGFAEFDPVFYELGPGIRNRVFVEYYLLPQSSRTPATHERMLINALASGRWLYELERCEGYRPGNWQIVGAQSLYHTAVSFPEFKESEAWRAKALELLKDTPKKISSPTAAGRLRSSKRFAVTTQ